MPFQNQAQNRACRAEAARNPDSTWDCSEWARETPGGVKSLPKGPTPKKKPPTEPEKAAFYAAFLAKCATVGLTAPAQVADAAEALVKAANGFETLGQMLGGIPGTLATTATLGSVGLPLVAGAGIGALAAGGANQADREDKEVLRRTAAANAYRRQADAARLHAHIKRLVASDPKKYVPLG